jgi:xanthine dehydrogenase accessory factor
VPEPRVEEELARRLREGREVVLATVVRTDGEPPSRPGAKLLLDRGGLIAGTLGCSEFDSAAKEATPDVLASGAPALKTFHHDLGSIDAYLEPYAPAPVLLVMGATPVAEQLRRWAPELGFRVAATPGEVADGAELLAVHTDHDAVDLPELLEAVLERNPRYVGLVGSRRHTGHHLEALRAKGVAEEDLERIQTPVGLDVGARTPAEIALSILAGLVAIRAGVEPGWKDRPKG